MTSPTTSGKDRVVIFDTTLRDGEQCPGATMTHEEKLEVAEMLDAMGVDIIEAGFPIASVGDFEAVAEIAKQTASALVDKLEAAGWVERVPDPTDGRARLVRPTSKAEPFVPVAHAEERAIEAEWEAHLGAQRMAELRSSLESLREITDPYL